MRSIHNNLTSPLADGQTFFGQAERLENDYQFVVVSIKADTDCLLTCQFSNDAINFDHSYEVNVVGSVSLVHQFSAIGRHYKIKLENNSGGDQTYCRMHTNTYLQPVTMPSNGDVSIDIHDGKPNTVWTLFDNEAVEVGDVSLVFDVKNENLFELLIVSDTDPSVFLVEISPNNVDWGVHTQVAVTGNVVIPIETYARYIRLAAGTDCNVTAHLMAKN